MPILVMSYLDYTKISEAKNAIGCIGLFENESFYCWHLWNSISYVICHNKVCSKTFYC